MKKKCKKENYFLKFVKLCEYYNVNLSQGFVSGVKKNVFCLDFEPLSYDQTVVLGECLKFLNGLTSLEVFGRFNSQKIIGPSKVLSKNASVKTLANYGKAKKNPKSHGFYHISKLILGINSNLLLNKSLKTLKISGLQLDSNTWKLLAKGLEVKNSIHHIFINNCSLKDSDLSVLQKGLCSKSLKTINLDRNELGSASGEILGCVISIQNSVKESNLWKSSLRTLENVNCNPNLTEISLSYNNFNDKAVVYISRPLSFDTCIKSLDFEGNKISSEGYKEILNLLEVNNSLVCINLVKNQSPEDLDVMHSIVERLVFNLNEYKKDLWFDKDVEWDAKIIEISSYFEGFTKAAKKFGKKTAETPKKLLRTDKKTGEFTSNHTELHRIHSQKPIDNCRNCANFEKELFHSKSQCIELQLQNNNLIRKLEKAEKY